LPCLLVLEYQSDELIALVGVYVDRILFVVIMHIHFLAYLDFSLFIFGWVFFYGSGVSVLVWEFIFLLLETRSIRLRFIPLFKLVIINIIVLVVLVIQ